MESTKQTFHLLLELSGIKKVYFIDDYLSNAFDSESVLALASDLIQKGKENDIISTPNVLIDLSKTPPTEIVNKLRAFFDGSSTQDQKIAVAGYISSINDNEYLKETKITSKIVNHFPTAEGLHPSKWDDVRENQLAKELKEGRILILFDHDLSKAQGFEARNGIELIKELKKKDFFDQIDCILISHDIVDAKEELPKRAKLIFGTELNESDFFPLSKKRLEVDDHFFDGIKKALINRYFETIKLHTVGLIEHSYKEAIKAIRLFDTYDFDDTILQTSIKEGVWVPETIIRISDIIFERELKRQMVDTNYALKVNKQLKEAQKFSGLRFSVNEEMQPYSDKLRLRHDETYDPGDIINSLRKPLENGDIFQLGDSKYILVAQACDMMVRGSGVKQGARNAKNVTLLKIITQTYQAHAKKKKEAEHYLRDKYPLPYFTSGKDEIGVVDFTDFLVVDIDLLDLCVLNAGGDCKINLNNQNDKDYLSLSWESRFDLLVEKLKPFEAQLKVYKGLFKPSRYQYIKRNIEKIIPAKILRRFQNLNSSRNQDILKIQKDLHPKIVLASSTPINVDLVKVNSDGTYDFLFKRIAKYKDHGATYLLERYTRHLSRIAEPHDFAFSKK